MAGAALLGYADLRERSPVLAVLLSCLVYTLPMAGWMPVRGMAWRPIVGMSGAVVALAVVIIGMAWVGVVSGSGLRGWAMGFPRRRAR
jgi:flagellar biosynthetic protein FliP